MKEKQITTSIRLSESIYNKLKKEANEENRSITGQIEHIIKKYWEIKKSI